MNTELMNFRIDSDVRSSFNSICKMKQTTMTTELVSMIRDFIDTEGEQVLTSYQKYKDLRSKFEDVRKDGKSRVCPTLSDSRHDAPRWTETPVQRHGNYVLDPISNTWMTETEWNFRR